MLVMPAISPGCVREWQFRARRRKNEHFHPYVFVCRIRGSKGLELCSDLMALWIYPPQFNKNWLISLTSSSRDQDCRIFKEWKCTFGVSIYFTLLRLLQDSFGSCFLPLAFWGPVCLPHLHSFLLGEQMSHRLLCVHQGYKSCQKPARQKPSCLFLKAKMQVP